MIDFVIYIICFALGLLIGYLLFGVIKNRNLRTAVKAFGDMNTNNLITIHNLREENKQLRCYQNCDYSTHRKDCPKFIKKELCDCNSCEYWIMRGSNYQITNNSMNTECAISKAQNGASCIADRNENRKAGLNDEPPEIHGLIDSSAKF